MVLRTALANLWFVTIHPFDDANGLIARAFADWARTLGEQPAALLQHVRTDLSRADRLLQHSRDNAEGNAERHAVDGMASRVPRTRV